MKVIIFGTGLIYQKYKRYFWDMDILCLLDNDKAKWGMQLDGISVTSPNRVSNYKYDYIFLMSSYFEEMRIQLVELGVPENKIIDKLHLGVFKNINQIIKYKAIEISPKPTKKKILLISHAFDLSGAPIVLTIFAKVLYRKGFSVEIFSSCNKDVGELLFRMLSQKISVSLYATFEFLNIDKICNNYHMVIINTMTLYSIIQKLSGKNIPVIWWLHEEENVYCMEHFQPNEISVGKNIHVYAVGQRAKAAYAKYSKNSTAKIMLYGIEEIHNKEMQKTHCSKLIFALIGFGCKRKGQDIVYEVLNRQLHNWEGKIEIWFIGDILESKQKIYTKNPCIICKGILAPDELREIYDKIDVLLCPSLNDPMPVVVSEAMMHKKACIVSDMTGQYEFITPYVDGLVCEAGNVESLETAMEWAINNQERLKAIGAAGYKLYKQYFSMELFERRVDEIIKNYLIE